MAIPALEIAMSMRYALGDMQGVNISDHELLEPINQAVNKLYSELGQRHSRDTIRTAGVIRINTSSSTKTNVVSTSDTGASATSEIDDDDDVVKPPEIIDINEDDESSGDGPSASAVTEYQYYTIPDNFVRIHQVLGAYTDTKPSSKSKYQLVIPTTGIYAVKGTYRLTGRIMRMPTGWYYVQYYYVPAKVKTLGDNIDAPESMRGWIEKLSVAMYKNDYNTMQVLLRQAENTFAGREIPRFENTEPAQTLGRTTVAE